jgi:hypothetical protein
MPTFNVCSGAGSCALWTEPFSHCWNTFQWWLHNAGVQAPMCSYTRLKEMLGWHFTCISFTPKEPKGFNPILNLAPRVIILHWLISQCPLYKLFNLPKKRQPQSPFKCKPSLHHEFVGSPTKSRSESHQYFCGCPPKKQWVMGNYANSNTKTGFPLWETRYKTTYKSLPGCHIQFLTNSPHVK